MSMGATRRKYDKAFKQEAVRLMDEEGLSAHNVERDLGISQGCIARWKRELAADPDHAFPGKGYLKPVEAENRRLRRELARMTRERDILKKAVAIFSEDRS